MNIGETTHVKTLPKIYMLQLYKSTQFSFHSPISTPESSAGLSEFSKFDSERVKKYFFNLYTRF
jgi:hypothetical protein